VCQIFHMIHGIWGWGWCLMELIHSKIWFMPFYMACNFIKLQFASLVSNQMILFDVSYDYSCKGIKDIYRYGCISTTTNWWIVTIMERGTSLWCIHMGNIQPQIHVYVEQTWFPNIRVVCRMCNQRPYGMPTLWPNYKSLIIKKVEKDVILWES
jgi:hypothetical protein